MERAVKAGDIDSYHLLNLQFHDALVAFTGTDSLATLTSLVPIPAAMAAVSCCHRHRGDQRSARSAAIAAPRYKVNSNAAVIVTNDGDYRKFAGIRVRNPFS